MKNKGISSKSAIAYSALSIASAVIFLLPTINYFLLIFQVLAPLFLFLYLIVIVFAVYRKSRRLIFAGLFSYVLVHSVINPVFNISENSKAGKTDLKVAHYNVLVSNDRYDEICNEVEKLDPDFISFHETSREWVEKLIENLQFVYPYYLYVNTAEESFGMAVFSKFHIEDGTVKYICGVPNITGTINMNGNPVSFVTSHTHSPTSPDRFELRNREIEGIANLVNETPNPVIVTGDFNSVPWDSCIKNLMSDTGMADSRKDYSPTYPSFGPLKIPIDYIFHSGDIVCNSFQTIESDASDHYGIYGEYHIAEDNKKTAFYYY